MELILFSHVALACKDMFATEAYYTKHFGFRRARVIGSGRDQVIFLGSRSATMYLELFAAKEVCRFPRPKALGPRLPGSVTWRSRSTALIRLWPGWELMPGSHSDL